MNWYVIIGSIIGFCAWTFGAYEYGKHVDDLEWTVADKEKQRIAEETLKKANAKIAETEAKNADLIIKMDQEHDEHIAKINDVFAENKRLLDQLNGLWGKGRGTGGNSPATPAPSTSGVVAEATTKSGLPGYDANLVAVFGERLLDHDRKADLVAEYAQVAYEYAVACHGGATNEPVQMDKPTAESETTGDKNE